MGWSNCGTDSDGRPIGYGFAAICDEPGCTELIDRGLAHACGGMHGACEFSCERYFCGEHLYFTNNEDAPHQLCKRCARVADKMVKPRRKRHAVAMVLLALLAINGTACASLKESWTGPRYRQIHTPGDDGARRDGKVEVLLSVDRPMLVAPGRVAFTARFRGDMDACTEVRWLYADGDSSSGQDCSRAATKLHFLKDEGATVVAVLGEGDHVIGRGAVTVRIGGESE